VTRPTASSRLTRSILVACVVLAAAGACGDDADDAATTDTSAPPTSEASTTTTGGETTTSEAPTTAPPTTTATTAANCPEAERPGEIVGSATGDLDGDGTDDTVELVHTDLDEWLIFAALGTGGDAAGPIVADGPLLGADVLGVADVQGDGTSELFLQVGSGASAAIVGLYTVTGCDVEPVTFEGGPSAFPVGASIGATSGLQCGPDGTLFAYASASSDGESYDVTWSEMALDGSVLTVVDEGTGTASYGDELHTAASSFHCGALTY
jgi:hypothetical protein